MNDDYLKMYIAVLDEVPDFIVPTLVAHSVLAAHMLMNEQSDNYDNWLSHSYRKAVVRVNKAEFAKIKQLDMMVHAGHENKTLGGVPCCLIVEPVWNSNIPNVLKFAKLWKPLPPVVTPV